VVRRLYIHFKNEGWNEIEILHSHRKHSSHRKLIELSFQQIKYAPLRQPWSEDYISISKMRDGMKLKYFIPTGSIAATEN